MKQVLMIAYHFPPMNVSSGIQRTLRFAQYLPQFGWEPVVLTADARAYSGSSRESLAEVPSHLDVRRVFALDSARHFALRGRYLRWLCVPDRWWTWWCGAVPAGLALIRKRKPDVLWSTYPIATAHLIGYTLHRLTGVPWVADFRDPMTEPGYPIDPLERRAYEWIESRTVRHCRRAVFAAPGALALCHERYADVPRTRLAIIENGYDESAFAGAGQSDRADHAPAHPLVLVHSGSIYPFERDPRPFFAALSGLKRSGRISAGELRVVLRATGSDDYLRGLIQRCEIGDLVTLAPPVPYRVALSEMLAADGLLVLQAAACNRQVPAKLYEYLRARRPVLALADPAGDTAAVLRDAGIDTIARLDSQEEIATEVVRFMELLKQRRAPVASERIIAAATRQMRTGELATILDGAAG